MFSYVGKASCAFADLRAFPAGRPPFGEERAVRPQSARGVRAVCACQPPLLAYPASCELVARMCVSLVVMARSRASAWGRAAGPMLASAPRAPPARAPPPAPQSPPSEILVRTSWIDAALALRQLDKVWTWTLCQTAFVYLAFSASVSVSDFRLFINLSRFARTERADAAPFGGYVATVKAMRPCLPTVALDFRANTLRFCTTRVITPQQQCFIHSVNI